jgi:hypothetical protein
MRRTASAALCLLLGLVDCGRGRSGRDGAAPPPSPVVSQQADTPDASVSTAAASTAAGPSVVELSRRARAALPRAGIGLHLSPPLPATWPPASAPQLEWFAYEQTPLATGVIASNVEGPLHVVSLALPDGEPRAAMVSDRKALGRDTGAQPDVPDLAAAEQALVDVLLGRRTLDSARADLAPYSRWATAASPIGADLRRRKPEFFRWLDAAKL